MFNRLLRAIRLEPDFYREIAGSPAYTLESFLLAAIFAVIPSLSQLAQSARPELAFIAGTFNDLVFGWFLWAVIANFVGVIFYHSKSNLPGMLRVLGYASLPRLLDLLAFIPIVGWVFHFAGWLMILIAGIIGIRECLEIDTNKAVIVSLAGLILYILAGQLLGIFLNGPAVPLLPFLR